MSTDLRDEPEGYSSFDAAALLQLLAGHWLSLAAAFLLAGVAGYGASFAFRPTFVSANTFIPPQQQQGGAAAALASLGALSSLVGGGAVRSSADQYVALMQSVTVSDRIIRKFDLLKVYETDYMQDARKTLAKNVRIGLGKKDGLIRVEAEDTSAERAAAMANQYVDELRTLSAKLAVTEAQQRRVFFEQRLQETKGRLVEAQRALEQSGFSAGAMKAEPRSAAEGYAKLRADLTVAKVRLQVLRGTLADTAAEVQQQLATVRALSQQVDALEESPAAGAGNGPDYISKYREFKYQETLFDLFAKQFELARLDESREGSLIQVVDTALPAEKKSSPRRSMFAAVTAFLGLSLMAWRHFAANRRTLRPSPQP